MKAAAYAKVNLALAVFPPAADGYHPLRGIFQSVSLADTVRIEPASDDAITVSNDEAPADETNLAWRAVLAVRRTARVDQPAALHLDKRIPAGSGLGGGSADAAAALGLMAERYGVDRDEALDIAAGIGADVPFAFEGGTMLAEGRGHRLTAIDPLEGFAIAIVVPPFPMSTPEVYREWDRLGSPEGDALPDGDLPPALRGYLPIRNDLYPAAASLDPRIAEWRSELTSRWGTSVAMTGSGSAMFAFFPGLEEARDAAAAFDLPNRLAIGVEPVPVGWHRVDA